MSNSIKHMRSAILSATLLCLSACAPLRWERPDTDASTLGLDSDRCLVQARDRLARTTGPMGPAKLDPKFGPDTSQPTAADRRIQEQQLADSCMREKGYRLVPADKSAAR